MWGGKTLASADGLRSVVPVKSGGHRPTALLRRGYAGRAADAPVVTRARGLSQVLAVGPQRPVVSARQALTAAS